MSSTQFLHTAQFFQTIFCFSILVLIGQQFILIWRQLDEKFMGMKVKEYNEQELWLRNKLNVGGQAGNGREQNKQGQSDKNKQQNKPTKPPRQQTLRSSLVGNEHDQTDRGMYQKNQQQTSHYKDTRRKSTDSDGNSNKRKSLTDLRKQQLKNQKQQKQQQKHQQLKQIQIKDQSDATVSRKQSIDSQILQTTKNNNNRRHSSLSSSSAKLQKQLQKLNMKNNLNNQNKQQEQPSVVNSNYSADHQYQNDQIRTQIKTHFKLQVLRQVDIVFGEHLAILVPLLILGILVHSTYIFTIVCFFGYGFSHLLVHYTGNRQLQQGLFSRSKLGKIIPKLFIVAIFISYWADKQFS